MVEIRYILNTWLESAKKTLSLPRYTIMFCKSLN